MPLLLGKYSFNPVPSSFKQNGYPKAFDLVKSGLLDAELTIKTIGYQFSFPEETAANIRKAGINLNIAGGKQYWMEYNSFIQANHGGTPFWEWSESKCRAAADGIPDVAYIAFDVEWQTGAFGPYYDVEQADAQAQRYAWIYKRLKERNPNVGCYNWIRNRTFQISGQGTKLFGFSDAYQVSDGGAFLGRGLMDDWLNVFNAGATFTLNSDAAKEYEEGTIFNVGYGYKDTMWANAPASEDNNVKNSSSQVLYLSSCDQHIVASKLKPNMRQFTLAWPVEEPGVEYSTAAKPMSSGRKVQMADPNGSLTITDKPRYDPSWWEDRTLMALAYSEGVYFWDGKGPVRSDRIYALKNTAQCSPPGYAYTGSWSGSGYSCPTPQEHEYMDVDAAFVDAGSRASHRVKQMGESFVATADKVGFSVEYVRDVNPLTIPADESEAATMWNALSGKQTLPAYTDGRHFNRAAKNESPFALKLAKSGDNKRGVLLQDCYAHPGKVTWFKFSESGQDYYVRSQGNRLISDTYFT